MAARMSRFDKARAALDDRAALELGAGGMAQSDAPARLRVATVRRFTRRDVISRYRRTHPWRVVALCLPLTVLIGIGDLFTGHDVQMLLFYGLPVVAAAWYGARRSGVAVVAIVTFVSTAIAVVEADGRGVLTTLANGGFSAAFYLFVVWVVSRERESVGELQTLATCDPLTNSLTRRAFLAYADEEIIRARRYPEPITVVFLDVDGLKQVNDQYGHDVGDALLANVGECAAQAIRATDRLGRLGGDEFAILLPQTDQAMATQVIQRLSELLRAHRISASCGIATFIRPPPDASLLIQAADACMYRAKNAGSGVVARSFEGTEPAHLLDSIAAGATSDAETQIDIRTQKGTPDCDERTTARRPDMNAVTHDVA